jgi:hypothetical protein
MQDNLTKSELLSGIEVGRESEEMCLLARLFNGFANSTRLSILLLLVQRGEGFGSSALPGLVRLRAGAPRGPQRVLLGR